MAINDHWLKFHFPGFLTGKISDFCGVFYLPIFLLALSVGAGLLRSRSFQETGGRLNWRNLWIAILCTDFLLLSVKLSPLIASSVEHFFQEFLFRIQLNSDPTDLVALVMNPLTILYMQRFISPSKRI